MSKKSDVIRLPGGAGIFSRLEQVLAAAHVRTPLPKVIARLLTEALDQLEAKKAPASPLPTIQSIRDTVSAEIYDQALKMTPFVEPALLERLEALEGHMPEIIETLRELRNAHGNLKVAEDSPQRPKKGKH